MVDAHSAGRGQSLIDLRTSGKCSFFAGTSSINVDDLYSVQTDLLPIVGEHGPVAEILGAAAAATRLS